MKFFVPLIVDVHNQTQTWYGLETSLGWVLFIFRDPVKLDAFMQLASSTLSNQETSAGYASVDAESLNSVVSQILQMDPSLVGKCTFIQDSDPAYLTIYDMWCDFLKDNEKNKPKGRKR